MKHKVNSVNFVPKLKNIIINDEWESYYIKFSIF